MNPCVDEENEDAELDIFYDNVDLTALLRNCGRLVTFFKKSGNNSLLKATYKNGVDGECYGSFKKANDTRWGSSLRLLKSVMDAHLGVVKILTQENLLSRFPIDTDLLNLTIGFLEIFDKENVLLLGDY